MTARRHNTEEPEYGLPDLIWPTGLIQPSRPPQLLYLDLNHWINLARARRGRGTPQYTQLLASVTAAVERGAIQVVLTGALFREIGKIADPAQRQTLTDLIGKLTDFRYLAGLADILRIELGAALDATTGTHGVGYNAVPLLGRSALTAFGKVGGLRVMSEDGDVTEQLIAEDPSFRARLKEMERLAETMLLAGPGDADIPALRADGYQPEIPIQTFIDNAAFEQDWDRRIAPYRRSHGVRDLVVARHLNLELLDFLNLELARRGIPLERVLPDRDAARRLVLGMPSSCVIVSLLAQLHQDPNRTWTANDLYDIDALAIAVPYCDIVLTDAAVRDAILRRGLDDKMGTTIPRRPEELAEVLASTGA